MTTPTPGLSVRFDGLRTLNYTGISAAYAPVGGVFTHLVRLLKFINTTNADMYFSFDGVTDNEYVPSGGFALYDFDTNSFITSPGTQIFVKQAAAPGSGNVFVVCAYARGQ